MREIEFTEGRTDQSYSWCYPGIPTKDHIALLDIVGNRGPFNFATIVFG